MLTETEARELLAQAALTIDVDPVARPVPLPSRSRRWVTVAAAAATAAVLGGVTILAFTQGGPDKPLTHPSPSPTSSSGTTLGTDQVPSVFGYDARSAQAMLEAAGLTVTVKERKLYCTGDDGRALATSPPGGTTYAPGDAVTLIVGKNQPVPCPYSPKPDQRAFAWALLDFANGRAPTWPLTRTGHVTLSVNGRSTVVSAKEFGDPASWPVCKASTNEAECPGSALDVLREASAEVLSANGSSRTPELYVSGRDTRLSIGVEIPGDGQVSPYWTIVVDRVSTRPPAGAPAYSRWAISSVRLIWGDQVPTFEL